jgi:hypothetical protein
MLTPQRFPTFLLSVLLPLACGDGGGGHDSATGFSGGGLTGITSVTTHTSGEEAGSSGGAQGSGSTQAEPTTGASGSSGEQGVDASTGGTSTGEASTGEGAATTGPAEKFDLGGAPQQDDAPAPEDEACVKVDLLFVIDNSGSMKQEQDNLVASFPGFVQEIQQELADAESLHIGVVTTDDYEFNEAPCAGVLGGLVTQTGGLDSSAAACGPYASGLRYMTEQDDLAQRFACAAHVGTDGSGDEMPLDAALHALGPGLAAPGACNEGFVRADALLVLVLITDEEDQSIGDPPQWFNSLVALKGGVETNIVVLSLIGPKQPACPDAKTIALKLVEFTGMFTYGSVGQICAPSYQQFFHDAIAGIAEACDNFIPG